MRASLSSFYLRVAAVCLAALLVMPAFCAAQETEADTEQNISAQQTETEEAQAVSSANTYNILIIGSDRRDSSWNGNSDTIILVTFNHDMHKLFMVSFMRDLQADIPGAGTHKINYAYAVGGAQKLVETVRSNFGVQIDHYAAVDWEAMIDIVDALGGVDLEVKDYEVSDTNGYIDYYCGLHGMDPYPHYLAGSGMQHMDGVCALAYSRIRFVGNNDYERTERQRRVLESLLNSAQFDDPEALMSLTKTLLAEVDHDLSPLDIVGLLPLYQNAKEYELVTDRVPYDGMFYSQSEMLVPDQPSTNERLHQELYGEGY